MYGGKRSKSLSMQSNENEVFPSPHSLFPAYSDPHPSFDETPGKPSDNNSGFLGETEMNPTFSMSSDGTPLAVTSPCFSEYPSSTKRYITPDANKQIPLHVQTCETEETLEVKDPTEFPCFSPPPKAALQEYLDKLKQQDSQGFVNNNNRGDYNIPIDWSDWTSCSVSGKAKARLLLAFFVFLILIIIVLVIVAMSGGGSSSGGTNNNPSVMQQGNINVNGVPNRPDMGVTLPPNMLPPAMAPVAVNATVLLTPTQSPISVAPTVYVEPTMIVPTTPAPTMSRNHYLVGILMQATPMEILLNPYTPQGEAMIWMATDDKEKHRNNPRTIQRYALTVLDVALHSPEPRLWSNRNEHECNWPGITCNLEKHVTEINWARLNLKGTIPPELGLLTHLQILDIAQNQLKGTLDPLYSLKSLKKAFLFENQLTGTLSSEIQNCGNLTRILVGHNALTGTIPEFRLRPLEWFVVHFNRLTGTIPETLKMDLNILFDVSHNMLNGTIPENLATQIIPNVRHIHLDNNRFTGSIPGTFRELGKGRLRQLYLNDNQFSGAFPNNWKTVQFLNNIDISKNNFQNKVNEMCDMSVFEYGELVELRADCHICNCWRLCRTCSDNIDYQYDYDDDDWVFDDDTL